ncbi:HEAT repeat domain-containing protein [Allorhizobium taibaishanense]|nr:HEAT repeat domain-containing protein [Allorhizobium taibaishanense]
MASDLPSRETFAVALADGGLVAMVAGVSLEAAEAAGVLAAESHDAGAVDIISLAEALDWSTLDRSHAVRLTFMLRGFIGATAEMASRLIPFTHSLISKSTEHSSYGYEQAIGRWLEGDVARCLATMEALRSKSDSPFLALLLDKWRQKDPSAALGAALGFSVDKAPTAVRAAVIALGGYAGAADDIREQAVDALVARLADENSEVRHAAIFGAARCLADGDQSPSLVASLEALASDPAPDDRDQLITCFVQNRYSYPDPLRQRTFELMKDVTSKSTQVLGLVDAALSEVDILKDRQMVADTISAIVGNASADVDLKNFQSTLYRIQESGDENLGWFAIEWLLHGGIAIRDQVHDLFEPLDRTIYDVDLKPFNLTEEGIFFLARKIFGFLLVAHGPAASLLCACLQSLNGRPQKELEIGIVSFWLMNYPGDIELYQKLGAKSKVRSLKKSVGRVRKAHEAREAKYAALPSNPALQPSTSERRVQAEIEFEQRTKINRSAEEGSIFGNLFHKSTILHGRSSIFYMEDPSGGEPIRQVTPLASFEVSTPIARMGVLQPVVFDRMVRSFRLEELVS